MDKYADESYLTDSILAALGNSRRRIFIRYLADHEPVELKDVAAVIAEIEHCSEKSAYTSLYQTHAQKLAQVDIITQHNGMKTYQKGSHWHTAYSILDYCDNL